MTRQDLFNWLYPHCLADRVSIMYPKTLGDGPGWTANEADTGRAVAAWWAGSLAGQTFASVTAEGVAYTMTRGNRLGLVAHRDGIVSRFCIDLDAHLGGVDTTPLADRVDAFLGAVGVRFTSKGGKGLHLFYSLASPVPVGEFVAWARAWGFNRAGQPECFPKTEKLSQFWLPNEPNENGGDRHVSGDFAGAVVHELPAAPPAPRREPKPLHPTQPGDDEKPGAAFAKSATPWVDVLTDGAACVREFDGKAHWRRPGKTGGQISGTTGVCRSDDGRDFLYVFSSNWHPFEAQRCYDKFQAYALLRHGGDFAAAAGELGGQGWGSQAITQHADDVDLSAFEVPANLTDDASAKKEDPGNLPDEIINRLPGLLGDIIRFNFDGARHPQPELAVAGALCLVSAITGRKIEDYTGMRTNLYAVGVCPTGGGKERARKINRDILSAPGNMESIKILANESWASGGGIERVMQDHPVRLFQVDEIAGLLCRMKEGDRHLQHAGEILLKMFTMSDSIYVGEAHKSSENDCRIAEPHMVVYGTTNADDLWNNITTGQIHSGLIGRIVLFDTRGRQPVRVGLRKQPTPPSILATAEAWAAWMNGGELAAPIVRVVEYDADAKERIEGHEIAVCERQIEEEKIDPARAALWARTGEKTRKLALIIAAARVPDPSKQTFTVCLEDVNFAIAINNWATKKACWCVANRVADSKEDGNRKLLLRIITRGKDDPHTLNEIGRRSGRIPIKERRELLADLVNMNEVGHERQQKANGGRPVDLFWRLEKG